MIDRWRSPEVSELEHASQVSPAIASQIRSYLVMLAKIQRDLSDQVHEGVITDEAMEQLKWVGDQLPRLLEADIRNQRVRLEWVRGLSDDELRKHCESAVLEVISTISSEKLVAELESRGYKVHARKG